MEDIQRQPSRDTSVMEADDTLSKRGARTVCYEEPSSKYFIFDDSVAYDPIKNPKGCINLGLSFNGLIDSEVKERLSREGNGGLVLKGEHISYFPIHGIRNLREAVASFLTRHLCPQRPVSPENLLITNGLTSCLRELSFALFDEGDILITPTPVYKRIFTSFSGVNKVNVEPLHLSDKADRNGISFALHPEDLELLIQRLQRNGKHVKAFILLNPQNPLGEIYSVTLLKSILDVCTRYNLHFILDEIYAFSCFDSTRKFISALSLEVPNPARVHVLWGFSKDFGIPGFRIGVFHSHNPLLLKAMRTLAHYTQTPSVTQDAAASLINDVDWCDNFFLPTNYRKLEEAHDYAVASLEGFGVPVRPSHAGLFLWANFSDFLIARTEAEESALFKELLEAGVHINPGMTFRWNAPGWFRIVFAVDRTHLQEGLKRIKDVLQKRKSKMAA